MSEPPEHAVRAGVHGAVQGVGLREATVAAATDLGLFGWVRHGEGAEEALVHAEGSERDVEALLSFLREGPVAARVDDLTVEVVKPEGHEQFAIRGVAAGEFVVSEPEGGSGGFLLCLEVDDARRCWTLPKGPSMDPATKRMAFEAADPGAAGAAWDHGPYEQGGRVAWPEAIERGHAVFVLHGERLSGGFALQRIRPGARPQWLLIKRSDDLARRGSDVVAESRG